MSENQDPIQDLENRIRNAKAELHSADIDFRDVAIGIARALQQTQEESAAVPQLDDGNEAEAETSNKSVEALANYYMDQLRETADRHSRAADLVPQEDVAQLKTQLVEEEATWVGEGGDEFSDYLREVVNYSPQPKASIRDQSDDDTSDITGSSRTGGAGDESSRTVDTSRRVFAPLDKVHDVVLNLREDEIRCFFSSQGNTDVDGAEKSPYQLVVGSSKMSLETLRNMAEFSEDELPIFTPGTDRAQIGKLQADIIPLAQDGSFPPFEDQSKNPFVNSADELIGREIRFAIRVRGFVLNSDENEEGEQINTNEHGEGRVCAAIHEQLLNHTRKSLGNNEYGRDAESFKPLGFFVRYKILPAGLLIPSSASTHNSAESGLGVSNIQSISHSEEWSRYQVDEDFLDQLSSGSCEIQFEIVACDGNHLNTNEDDQDEEQDKQSEQDKPATTSSTPKTLSQLLELRANKHIDLARRLEAEILRENSEKQRQEEEEQQFVAEFHSAFNEDMKHLRRTIDKLREMLKESIHHKSRGTAKQMTAEHALKLKEVRTALKREKEEKAYNKTCATNRVRAVEVENLKSEIHNLERRKTSTFAKCEENEKGIKEEAELNEQRLEAAISVRNKLQVELKEISNIRADVNLRHTQLRKTLFDEHHNEHVKKQHEDAVKRYISNSVARSNNNNNASVASNNTRQPSASVTSTNNGFATSTRANAAPSSQRRSVAVRASN